MHNLQPALAGRDYSLLSAVPGSRQGSAPAFSEWRLALRRAIGAPAPPDEDAPYWDPCA